MSLKLKLAVLVALLVACSTYTEEDHVLVLTTEDFDSILKEFPQIMIEFYAPWCGHCKKLAPIYTEVAAELYNAGVNARVAKIDCDAHSSIKEKYSIQGFPTLLYFSNGEQIKFSGQRTKEFIFNWIVKKTRSPVTTLTAEKLEQQKQSSNVFLVLYGSVDSEAGKIFSSLANTDDFNQYFNIQGDDAKAGTVEIYRSFGDTETYKTVDAGLKDWIKLYERPYVVPFDDRTIAHIFSEALTAILLFNKEDSKKLSSEFANAATEWKKTGDKPIIFSQLQFGSTHINELASYLKIDTTRIPVVILRGSDRVKLVLKMSAKSITSADLISFIKDQASQKQYTFDEDVTEDTPEDTDL